MEIAILLLNNFGDILYATPVAKQIKEIDFPGCTLTWIVSKQCSSLLQGHPYVDKLEVVDLVSTSEVYSAKWDDIEKVYARKLAEGIYDHIFNLQPIRRNLIRYKSGIRKMILDAYPFRIKVPLQPIVFLTEQERSDVSDFVEQHAFHRFTNRILFEFAPTSGQSNVTREIAVKLAEDIANQNESTCVILSSNLDLPLNNPKLFNAKTLSFRQNAELINHCTLLLGCSSGISWLSTSTWCKSIPTVQYVNVNVPWFNSMKLDFKRNHIGTGNIIELYHFDESSILKTVNDILDNGFSAAKKIDDQQLPPGYSDGNFRTVANELSQYSHRDFIIFVTKNLFRKSFLNRFYLGRMKQYGLQYLKRAF